LGLVLLGVLVTRVDFSRLTVRWSWLLLAGAGAGVLLLLTAQGTSALRWRTLLGPGAAPWPYLFRLYLIAAFFSLFLPTAVGGDVVRAAAATRSLGRTGHVVGTVLLDRALGVVALVAFFVLGLLASGGATDLALGWRISPEAAAVGLAAMGGAVGLIWRYQDSLSRRLPPVGEFFATIGDLSRKPRQVVTALALGFGAQAAYLVAWLIVAKSLGIDLPAASFLLTVPVVSLSTMIPLTISGVGIREGAWIVLLAPYGVPAADALTLSLVYFGCWMLVAAVGGVWFAWKGTGVGG
jgi:uncharacterized membrane protein YbhN (UPF0104 family)